MPATRGTGVWVEHRHGRQSGFSFVWLNRIQRLSVQEWWRKQSYKVKRVNKQIKRRKQGGEQTRDTCGDATWSNAGGEKTAVTQSRKQHKTGRTGKPCTRVSVGVNQHAAVPAANRAASPQGSLGGISTKCSFKFEKKIWEVNVWQCEYAALLHQTCF